LVTSTINVYIRDTRYVVESINTVLFWLVPIFYSFDIIPAQYADVYQLNPVANLVFCLRHILIETVSPPASSLWKLSAVSFTMLFLGTMIFRWGKRGFFEHI
jgi:ABC-type polysaccharide/polyol phosphate export permease